MNIVAKAVVTKAECAMKIGLLLMAISVIVCTGPGAAAAQSEAKSPDIGSDVLNVFAAKCAICHGPDVTKPQGRFGYVLNLKSVAGNPEMIIAPYPDQSELWLMVQHDEMPPPDSPQGPLNDEQKEIIRTWIAAGAPEPLVTNNSPPSVCVESTAAAPPVTAVRIQRWMGKFHFLMIHFPIALIFAAGLSEGWSLWRRSRVSSNTVRFCLWMAAIAAVPTAAFGWLYAAGNHGTGSTLLLAHRWLGTTAAVWLILTAICAERDARRGERGWIVRLLLATAISVVALTAHLGGLLVHGSDFFDF